MNEPVLEVLERELLGAGADIPFLVPVSLVDALHRGYQHVAPDIEFPLIIQERHQVTLHNVGSMLAIWPIPTALHHFRYLLDVVEHLDPVSLVRVFARLHYP